MYRKQTDAGFMRRIPFLDGNSPPSRFKFMQRWPALMSGLMGGLLLAGSSVAVEVDPNSPGVLEPVLTAVENREVRIPHTDQVIDGLSGTVVGDVVFHRASDTTSLLGQAIGSTNSPNRDMGDALKALSRAARAGDSAGMQTQATDLLSILMGTTQGRIYDGFSMLNFNRGSFVPGHVSGEYKMKRLRDTGLTEEGIDGQPRKIWEIDISMLYYDGQIDSDTFLMVVPVEAHEFDTVRVNYRIYSTVREDFSPTVVMLDRRLPGSVQFPFKGLDSVWIPFSNNEVVEFTMQLPPLRLQRGVYTWGWRVHPPRIQFLQPIFETINAHTGLVELDPQGTSYATRNREDLTLDNISDAAPEKKMYQVATAVLSGASPAQIDAWLNQADQGPRGTWQEWASLVAEQRQLPPEAWDVLAAEGLQPGDFGPYRMVTAYMNNEMYGEGPDGASIAGWNQGDRFEVKLINLDKNTHYFRNVDFGPRLHDDIRNCCGAGSHSFEVMNFKGTYGIPKVAEAQWRAGWGFRPHFNVIQQQNVFTRAEDQTQLKPFTGGFGQTYFGYQWSAEARGGDFRFNPPPFIITDVGKEPPFPLRDEDGLPGLVIGQLTEGTGTAQMCPDDPAPGFCATDISAFNPNGALNWPPPPLQGVNGLPDHPTELRFPPFLRNPAQGNSAAGDIIPPTPAWKPFLFLNPANGTIYIDPADHSKGHWVDFTMAHGSPVFAGGSLNATIEAPRASAQVFYQFDDLFHDNSIFSPHPKTGADAINADDQTEVGVGIDGPGPLVGSQNTRLEDGTGH